MLCFRLENLAALIVNLESENANNWLEIWQTAIFSQLYFGGKIFRVQALERANEIGCWRIVLTAIWLLLNERNFERARCRAKQNHKTFLRNLSLRNESKIRSGEFDILW